MKPMQPVEKFSISMPQEMARAIRESVATGEFTSTSEALRDAVRVWQRQRLENAERLTAIRNRIRRSLDDPQTDLSIEELDASLAAMFADAEHAGGDGTA